MAERMKWSRHETMIGACLFVSLMTAGCTKTLTLTPSEYARSLRGENPRAIHLQAGERITVISSNGDELKTEHGRVALREGDALRQSCLPPAPCESSLLLANVSRIEVKRTNREGIAIGAVAVGVVATALLAPIGAIFVLSHVMPR